MKGGIMEADGNGVGGEGGYPVAENWCSTDIGQIEFSYMWTINKFSHQREKTGEYLKSSTFSCGTGDDETKWFLKVYPKYDSAFLCICVCLDVSKSPEVRAKMKLSIINDQRKESFTKEFEYDYKRGGEGSKYSTLINLKKLLDETNGLLPKDRLTIFCKGSVLTEPINVSGQCSLQIPECQISTDLGNLFASEAFYDCIITASSRQFRVHKNILGSRSPVFKAMFENDMKEKLNGRVEIDDLEPDVVEGMLEFMYTGSVKNSKFVANDLLAAADKYQLKRLKVMCEVELCYSLTTENACQTLIHADIHSAEQLKAYVLNFINARHDEVVKTSGWVNMVKERPHLCLKTFDPISEKKVVLKKA